MAHKLVLFSLFLFVGSILFALTVDQGNVRLVVNDKSGRFSLFQTRSLEKPDYRPLFVANDPTTSQWRVLINKKMSILGDSSLFTTGVEKLDGGAKISWTSTELAVTMRLQFLQATAEAKVVGLRIDVDFLNTGAEALDVGLRWLLDTNLGEKKDHFFLPDGTAINGERSLIPPYPAFWSSSSPTEDDLGLHVFLGGACTPPQQVIFANWKRLKDAPWSFDVQTGREFNLLPYSYNDSAVLQLYPIQTLEAKGTRRVTTEISLRNIKSLDDTLVVTANPIDALLTSASNPALSSVDQDLATVDNLLKQIDVALKNPGQASADDVRLLKAVLDQIESRRKTLTPETPQP